MGTIAFFNIKEWEKNYISKKLKGHKAVYFEESLDAKHIPKIKDVDCVSVFIHSKVPKDILAQLPNLKLVALRSTGFDHVDLVACQAKNVAVSNVPFYGENTVAEHAFGLLLSISTQTHKAYERSQKKQFSTEGLTGFDLKGKTVGVIGGGHIGMHFARMARGFGMKVLVYDVIFNHFLEETIGFEYVDLPALLKQSDAISIHTPYNKYTHHIVSMENIRFVKKGCVLINTARGACLCSDSLKYGLDKGFFKAAGLDVIEDEEMLTHPEKFDQKSAEFKKGQARALDIVMRPNVLFTPHNAFNSQEALNRILDATVENIMSGLSGKFINTVKPQ